MEGTRTAEVGQDWMCLREAVMHFLRRRGATDPEELAQEAVFRVLVNVLRGSEIQSMESYTYGVAGRVFQEHRRHLKRHEPLDEDIAIHLESESFEQQFASLMLCKLRALSEDEIKLLEAYYPDANGNVIVARQRLALRLGLSPNALRLRVSRLRRKLQQSLRAPGTSMA